MEVNTFASTYMVSQLSIFPWSGFMRPFDHSDDQVPIWRTSMQTYKIVILILKNLSKPNKQEEFHATPINDSEHSSSINVMNTWHPGKQSDTLCQILNFKISTAAYT